MGTDDDPQVAQVKPDEVAALVAVADSVAAGPLPFEKARSAVQYAWALSQGAGKAKAAADALAKAISAGTPIAKALADAGLTGLPVQGLDARRGDLSQAGDRVPPPLAALFTLKQGTGTVLTMDQNRGFLVVRLDTIVPGDPAEAQKILVPTRAGLKEVFGSEYRDQLVTAAKQAVGVTRNASALAAVAKALREANGSAQ
jgi:peptidyl-prolyl cis-trans isomerase D